MSAKAEESNLPMKELLKPTGYTAPDGVADKTFAEVAGRKYYGWKKGSMYLFGSLGMPVVGDKLFNLMPTGQVNIITVTEVTSEDEITCGSLVLTRAPAYDFEL